MEINTDTDEEDGTTANTEMNDINLAILNENKNNENDSRTSVEPPEDDGLFVHTPKCFKNAFLSVYGLLFFLCWASTIQVITNYSDNTRVLITILMVNFIQFNCILLYFAGGNSQRTYQSRSINFGTKVQPEVRSNWFYSWKL